MVGWNTGMTFDPKDCTLSPLNNEVIVANVEFWTPSQIL